MKKKAKKKIKGTWFLSFLIIFIILILTNFMVGQIRIVTIFLAIIDTFLITFYLYFLSKKIKDKEFLLGFIFGFLIVSTYFILTLYYVG